VGLSQLQQVVRSTLFPQTTLEYLLVAFTKESTNSTDKIASHSQSSNAKSVTRKGRNTSSYISRCAQADPGNLESTILIKKIKISVTVFWSQNGKFCKKI